MCGIWVVNLVHSDGTDYYPVDYRVYHRDSDGKTKNDHFGEMLIRAKGERAIESNTTVFDSWYSSVANLKLVQRLGTRFVTALKAHRMVSLNVSEGYIHLAQLAWDAQQLEYGQTVKL